MCIYATESPGGYQLVGRTAPIWDAGRIVGGSREPAWAFRLMDRISFYCVSEETLDNAIASGTWHELVTYEEGTLDLNKYESWLAQNSEHIQAALQQQAEAVQKAPFYGELLKPYEAKTDSATPRSQAHHSPSGEKVKANMPGRCFRIEVSEGQEVDAGDVLVSFFRCEGYREQD